MDNEKYGIELDLITDKFNSKIKKVKNEVASVNKAITVKDLNKAGGSGGWKKAPVQLMKQWVQQTNAETKAVGKLKDNYTELNASSSKLSIGIEKGLKKSTSAIKRFGLSLLGLRSIWALVSRASSAYLAQDTELSNKLQSVWAGLGAMLAPIIESIANILMKAVKYINIFITALTGVDLLAKASAKSINSTAKAAKGLNKALAGFDELQNLDTEAGGGIDTGVTNPFQGIQDVEINTKWADRIQKFGEWVRKNWKPVLALLGATAVVLGAIKIASFVTALLRIEAPLSLILSIAGSILLLIGGIILFIKGIIDYLKNPTWGNFIKILAGLALAVTAVSLLFGAVPALIVTIIGIIVALGLAVYKNWDKIKEVLGKVADWIYQHIIEPVVDFFKTAWETIYNGIKNIWDNIKDGFNNAKDWLYNNVIQPIAGFFEDLWNKVKNAFQNAWDFILNAFSRGGEIFSGIKDGIVTVFRTIVNALINGINRVIAVPFNTINNLLNTIKSVTIPVIDVKPFEGLWGWNPLPVPQIPQLNVGTNYVPEDQLAMIHKGEAIVPKKFNSEEYFGRNNEETNSLLSQVISAIENIEINPYTTIKDVGKASVSYINSKSRQLGESVIY